MSLVIDASVFVASARAAEVHYQASLDFLQRVEQLELAVYCPALVLAECSAAIARPTGDESLAREVTELVAGFPGMQLVPVTVLSARRGAELAAQHRLRGADALYVSTAELFDATLVSWDQEMVQRSAGVVATVTPEEWMASQPPAEA
jgi:predicted nucleic acid-binding protein